MSRRDVARLVYRSILRWVKATTDVPFLIRDEHVSEVFPRFASVQLRLEGSAAIGSMAQTSFRDNREMQVSITPSHITLSIKNMSNVEALAL